MFWGTRATNFSIYTTKMEGAGLKILGTGAKFKRVPCQKNCRVNRASRCDLVNGLDMIILHIVLVYPNKFCLFLSTCVDELIQVWIPHSPNAKQNIFQSHHRGSEKLVQAAFFIGEISNSCIVKNVWELLNTGTEWNGTEYTGMSRIDTEIYLNEPE